MGDEMSEKANDKYIDLYIDYLKYERKLSKNTVNSYSDNLDKFIIFLNNKITIDVDQKDIKEYLSSIKNMNDRTRAHYITVLRSFYKFLLSNNYINLTNLRKK